MHDTPPAALAHVAAPADADHVEDWRDDLGTGEYERFMRGTRRIVAGVEIWIVGWQQADGTVARHGSVWATETRLDAASLRQLAALASDAADELDQPPRSSRATGPVDPKGVEQDPTETDRATVRGLRERGRLRQQRQQAPQGVVHAILVKPQRNKQARLRRITPARPTIAEIVADLSLNGSTTPHVGHRPYAPSP
jgi:hypothetical protein